MAGRSRLSRAPPTPSCSPRRFARFRPARSTGALPTRGRCNERGAGSGPLTIEESGLFALDAVMRVMDDSFDPAFGEAWTGPQCAGLLPMPGVWLSLAREGEHVVGFALGRVVLREAELLLLAVRKEEQGRGIGQALLD